MIAIILVLFSFLSFGFDDSRCLEYSNDCEYYACVAEAKHCSRSSYPLQFGRPYCLRYGARMKYFSQNGKMWIGEVRKCLIHQMSTYEETLSCEGLKARAFSDHVPCYLETGFCKLSLGDKEQILKTIWPTIRNVHVISGGLKVLKACVY